MIKNVLLPTDFSENSWNAVRYALLLFRERRCNFYLLHVVHPHVFASGDVPLVTFPEDIDKVLCQKGHEELEKIRAAIESEYPNPNHHFETLCEYDFLIDAVRKQVDEKKADLIIMGTKGASGLKGVIIGSNTGEVITKVKCPVLAIPEDAHFHPPREIVFPTDYTMKFSSTVLETLVSLTEMFHSSIRVLHVVKNENKILNAEQESNKEYLQNYLKGKTHGFHRLTSKDLSEAIQHFTGSRDIDWIAMMAKKLHFFQQILFRPTVAKISYHTRIPLLVLHETKKNEEKAKN